MSLFNSYDRTQFLNELNSPLETQGQGVFTPATQRLKLLSNIYGSTQDGTVLLPSLTSGAVSDKALSVPNVASGGVLAIHGTTGNVGTHSIRIKSADGTLYYVLVSNSATGRTGGA